MYMGLIYLCCLPGAETLTLSVLLSFVGLTGAQGALRLKQRLLRVVGEKGKHCKSISTFYIRLFYFLGSIILFLIVDISAFFVLILIYVLLEYFVEAGRSLDDGLMVCLIL
jgi:hypothetical protein